jgi:hypothetical protein
MQNSADVLDSFVKGSLLVIAIVSARVPSKAQSAYLLDVWDINQFQLIAIGLEVVLQVLTLAWRTDGRSDKVALLEQLLDNPDGNVAIGACD